MNRFAELLDRLVLTPSRNGKLTLLTDYFRTVPDPDRGLALAAITGDLAIAAVKPAMLRALVAERMDPILFGYSYDYVGDLAETVSLVWPELESNDAINRNYHLLMSYSNSSRQAARMGRWFWRGCWTMPGFPARFAIIKLVTGGLRIGVSARLAKQAVADLGKVDVAEIEELWHGLAPPYLALFAWLEGRDRNRNNRRRRFSVPSCSPILSRTATWKSSTRPTMSPNGNGTVSVSRRSRLAVPAGFIRAPAMMFRERFPIWSTPWISTPRWMGNCWLATPPDWTGTFSDLQQRLNRKTVSAKIRERYPAFVRCYDILQAGAEDLRQLPFLERRQRLEDFVGLLDPSRFDLSPTIFFRSWEELQAMRSEPPHPIIEGVMIKHRQSAYVAGRPKGPWFKWKRDPYTVDAVLMYAQRGHGKRSSFYSDYTFGVWSGPPGESELVPVGKAYFGFTDEELRQIDKYVRDNTVERFGPVRSVRADRDHGLVLEIAFEGLNRSQRHKSGVAMRFPRISRLRWDKPVYEADRLETLTAMLD